MFRVNGTETLEVVVKTMQAPQIEKLRKPMKVSNIPVPEIGANDALVRVTASGICRTDRHLWNGDWTSINVKLDLPLVLGHKIGGVIEAVGSDVQSSLSKHEFACRSTWLVGTASTAFEGYRTFATTITGGCSHMARAALPNTFAYQCSPQLRTAAERA